MVLWLTLCYNTPLLNDILIQIYLLDEPLEISFQGGPDTCLKTKHISTCQPVELCDQKTYPNMNESHITRHMTF